MFSQNSFCIRIASVVGGTVQVEFRIVLRECQQRNNSESIIGALTKEDKKIEFNWHQHYGCTSCKCMAFGKFAGSSHSQICVRSRGINVCCIQRLISLLFM